ncbi:MAG: macrolide transporter subunit MacA [Candidatus Methylacidiphilales bacterium]
MPPSPPPPAKTLPRRKNGLPLKQLGWLLIGVAVLAAALTAIFYFNRPTAEVARVIKGRAVAAVYGTVKVEWYYVQPIRAQNSGFIQLADGIYSGVSSVGILVKKDQELASIVDENTARSIQNMRIDLQAATERQRIGPPSAKLLKTAEENLQRLQALQAQTQNVPRAQIEQLQNEVARLTDVVRAEKIEIDRVVDNLTTNLRNLQEKLGRSIIKSPIDGVLTAVNVIDGELVFENNTVFNVAVNRTYINGQVNEEDVGALRTGMKATVKLYSYPAEEFIATLTSILPTGDASTQRYTVILSFDNPPPNLMAGMTGEMNIILGERDNALLIPTRALVPGAAGGGDVVFVVKNDVVSTRPVQIGYRSLERVEILAGLEEGDQVIVADQDLFTVGQRVRAVEVTGSTPVP